MKVVQISDLHIVDPGEKLGQIDSLQRLNQAIEHINIHHSDAAFCAVTGDIADTASPLAYQQAKKALDRLSVPYHVIIGNHDLRHPFLQSFSSTQTEHGFVNYRIEHADKVFIFLDTVKENHDHGEQCQQRKQWLKSELNKVGADRPIYIFMHHPPFGVNIPNIDSIMLEDPESFFHLIKEHPVKYIFFGHIHRPSNGVWHHIPYSSNRSIGHYQLCAYKTDEDGCPMNEESPMYSVISFFENQVHIDLQDYLNDTMKFKT